MNNCNNTKTMGHGHIVKCGDNLYGKESPVYICEGCLKQQNQKMKTLLYYISKSNCRASEFYNEIVDLIGGDNTNDNL